MAPGTTKNLPLFIIAVVFLQVFLCFVTLVMCRASGNLEANRSSDVRREAFLKAADADFPTLTRVRMGICCRG
jgi:hypothetical protein